MARLDDNGSRLANTLMLLLVILFSRIVCCQQLQQQQQQQQQQQMHLQRQQDSGDDAQVQKYQQLQYQFQQQQMQQYERQRQLYQQQQQQQQQQRLGLSAIQASRLDPQDAANSEHGQIKLLKADASLVVDDRSDDTTLSADQMGQKEHFRSGSVSDVTDAQAPVRRRLGTRKRKRRPQQGQSSIDGGNPTDTHTTGTKYWRGQVNDEPGASEQRETVLIAKRRKQPAIREPLAALEQEQKLYEIRDKQRRPSTLQKHDGLDEATFNTNTNTGEDNSPSLKNILKASGGLSLSEILQQKNLSLQDLLNGKKNALLALQTTASSTPQTEEEPFVPITSLPPPTNRPTIQPNGKTSGDDQYYENINPVEDQTTKNKLKFPTLHKVKLFATQTRPSSAPGLFDTSTRRRDFVSSKMTTIRSSTTTSTTTTRMPLYKKRPRSTLKPSVLLKMNAATREDPPTIETTPMTNHYEDNTEMIATTEEEELMTQTGELNAETLVPDTTMKPSPMPRTRSTLSRYKNWTTGRTTQRHRPQTPTPPTVAINFIDAEVHNSSEASDEANDVANSFANSREDDNSSREELQTSMETIKAQNNSLLSASAAYPDWLPDFDGIDDRTDLLELIEDRRSGNRLFKVLEQRNMTLDELIEHRKRGSSQLHLATIINDQSRYFPGQKVVLQNDMDIVTAFENFPHFNLMNLKSVKPDDIKTDSQGSSYFTSIIDIEPTDELSKENAEDRLPQQRSEKSLSFFPSWKTLALAPLATTARNNAQRRPFILSRPGLLLEATSKEMLESDILASNSSNSNSNNNGKDDTAALTNHSEHPLAEAIENEVAHAHDLLDLELSGHGFRRTPTASASISPTPHRNAFANLPAGIRSAIVASAVIVITSLATFMLIFIVFRWKQQRRRRKAYLRNYNTMKSKLPTISTTLSTPHRIPLNDGEELITSVSANTTTLHGQHLQQHKGSFLLSHSTITSSVNNNNTQNNNNNKNSKSKSSKSNELAKLSAVSSDSVPESGASLALTLRNAHNGSTTKLNTLDPNSPEVQEYLFDTLRLSF